MTARWCRNGAAERERAEERSDEEHAEGAGDRPEGPGANKTAKPQAEGPAKPKKKPPAECVFRVITSIWLLYTVLDL